MWIDCLSPIYRKMISANTRDVLRKAVCCRFYIHNIHQMITDTIIITIGDFSYENIVIKCYFSDNFYTGSSVDKKLAPTQDPVVTAICSTRVKRSNCFIRRHWDSNPRLWAVLLQYPARYLLRHRGHLFLMNKQKTILVTL